jgi:hypothetical protein
MGISDKIALVALVISVISFIYTYIVDRRSTHLTALEKKNKFLENYFVMKAQGKALKERIEQLGSQLRRKGDTEQIKTLELKVNTMLTELETQYHKFRKDELKDPSHWESKMHGILVLQNLIEETIEECEKSLEKLKNRTN